MKRFLCGATACILLAGLCSCSWESKLKNISNDVNNYAMYPFSLKTGEKRTFDVRDIFKDSGIRFESYKIVTKEGGNYKVKGDTITAVGTGACSVGVYLYSKEDDTCYAASLGNWYSYDEKDFTEVKSAADLQAMELDKAGKYILKSDIDLSGVEWQPVGNLPSPEKPYDPFMGMLINPDGYRIKNLTISSAENIHQGVYGGCEGGLFGSIEDSFISGVKLTGVEIDIRDFLGEGLSGSGSYAGGIAGGALNCFIENCEVEGNIAATGFLGGMVGSVSWGSIENCSFSGTVTLDGDKAQDEERWYATGAGGIFGYCGMPPFFGNIRLGRIWQCKASGQISGFSNVGGICGYLWGKDKIEKCTFLGELSPAQRSGQMYGVAQEDGR